MVAIFNNLSSKHTFHDRASLLRRQSPKSLGLSVCGWLLQEELRATENSGKLMDEAVRVQIVQPPAQHVNNAIRGLYIVGFGDHSYGQGRKNIYLKTQSYDECRAPIGRK